MASETLELKKGITEICWFMRGSINYEQAWQLSFEDKKIIQEFIKDNTERFKGSMVPVV
jgi:hypothetical protein|tara:strand:+ start:412 stop:588 length:177 start_codon:yes stop_codon:yes gene_type:complete